MRRYGIAPMVQNVPNRMGDWHKAALYTQNIVQGLPPIVNGQRSKNWAFASFTKDNMQAVLNDGEIYVLPDIGLDQAVSAMESTARDGLKAALDSHGIDSLQIDGSWSYGQVIDLIGKALSPDFNRFQFSVPDI